jgi:4-hydroxybenzoate polyprenyltransferase
MLLRRLLELIRFSHTVFALPFALLSASMAWAANMHERPPIPFRWIELAGILVCMVFARSAAMSFNRLADRKLDALNPRTKMRHLPTGVLSVRSVVAFTIVCSLGFIGGTLLFLPRNPVPIAASVPVLLFLFGYSYAKRFTSLAHFWLGVSLMLAPMAAWAAIRPVPSWTPVVLGAAVLLWSAGFDMIYACQDYEVDVKCHLHSAPARWGIAGALHAAAVCHFGTVVLLLLLPVFYSGFGWIFESGAAAIGVLLIYEHWLVRPDDLRRVNQAFFNVSAVVSMGLLIVGLIQLAAKW